MSDALQAAVRDRLTSSFGLGGVCLVPLAGGYLHRVWRVDAQGGRLCAKLYQGRDWTPAVVEPTLAIQQAAWQAGLPVPRVHAPRVHSAADAGLLAQVADGWLAVFDFVAGAPLGESNLTRQAAAACGRVLGRVHTALGALPAGARDPFIPDPVAIRHRCTELLRAAQARRRPDALDRLAVTAAEYRLNVLNRDGISSDLYAGLVHQVIHGDYYPGNLLFGPRQVISGVIDWDFAGAHWRELEVGRALVECALLPADDLDWQRAAAFLAGYTSEQALTQKQRRDMFRVWFNYLLHSLYPLPLRYQTDAVLPTGWQAVARRRHRMLMVLDRHMQDLTAWASA